MRVVLLGLAAVLAVILGRIWKANGDRGGQQPAQPFRIAGNLYYVGANDATSFLITGPEGHVLLDGGYPGTAPMIMASIAKLGFNIKDVKRCSTRTRTATTRAGWPRSSRRPAPNCGRAKRVPESSPPAATTLTSSCP